MSSPSLNILLATDVEILYLSARYFISNEFLNLISTSKSWFFYRVFNFFIYVFDIWKCHTSAKRFHKMAVVSNPCNLHFSWLSVSPTSMIYLSLLFFFLICHFFHSRNIFLFDISIIIFKINFFILTGDNFIVNSWLSTTMVLTSVSEETIERFQ